METEHKQGVVRKVIGNRVLAERKDGTNFVVEIMEGGSAPKIVHKDLPWHDGLCHQWPRVLPDGLNNKGLQQYKELPEPMKGDTTLVPGEHKASDDFCEQDPSQIEVLIGDKKAIIVTHEIAWCSDPDTLIVCTAVAAAKGDKDRVDYWENLIDAKIEARRNAE